MGFNVNNTCQPCIVLNDESANDIHHALMQTTAYGEPAQYQAIAHTNGPFYQRGLTLIPAWISNYIHYKVCYEITYPFLNFNGATVEVWE